MSIRKFKMTSVAHISFLLGSTEQIICRFPWNTGTQGSMAGVDI